MQISQKIRKNKKSAFSLVEISVVLVIIGILVTGIIGGQALMNYGALSKARALTNSAPVSAIEGVKLWLETTSKKSFDVAVIEGLEVQTWNDINPQGLAKKNATQSTATQIPTYKTSSIDGLPTMRFDGANDFLILPDGTFPPSNSSYTVFIVGKTSSGAGTLLAAGDYGLPNVGFATFYNAGQVNDGWDSSSEVAASVGTYDINSPRILTFKYDNSSGRTIYVDGNVASSAAGNALNTNRATLAADNRIGSSVQLGINGSFLTGDIGEIIVFNVALDNIDRASIENYLSQKWGINVAS